MEHHVVLVYVVGCLMVLPETLSTNTWAEEELSKSSADFALKLYNVVRSKVGRGENIFMSPISISTAFAMLYAGARGNTKDELKGVFFEDFKGGDGAIHQGFQDLLEAFGNGNNNYTLRMANRLFGRQEYTFKEEYLQDTAEFYRAGLQTLNFSGDAEGSRQEINDWVAQQTAQKIKDLLPSGSVSEDTALVLVNAIYFKAKWSVPFKPRDTELQTFHLSPSSDIQVVMMNNQGQCNYKDVDDLDCRVLQLPYEGEEVSMYVFIPNKADGLAMLEKNLDLDHITDALQPRGYVGERCSVRLPKFNMTFTLSLKGVLRELGVRDVFFPEIADLSGIDGGRDLYVSDAAHKAFVDVNEEGTEAAGGTGIMIELTSLPTEVFADRPFLFVLKEKATGAMLFMGRYAKPPGDNPVVGAFGQRGFPTGLVPRLKCGPGLIACLALIVALFVY